MNINCKKSGALNAAKALNAPPVYGKTILNLSFSDFTKLFKLTYSRH